MKTVNLDYLIELKYDGIPYRLIFVLISEVVDKNGRIKTMTKASIADRLNTTRPNISKYFKKLINDGVIYMQDNDYYITKELMTA